MRESTFDRQNHSPESVWDQFLKAIWKEQIILFYNSQFDYKIWNSNNSCFFIIYPDIEKKLLFICRKMPNFISAANQPDKIKADQHFWFHSFMSLTYAAIKVTALTVVKRVISFLSRSRNIGRQRVSSCPRLSPMFVIIWPLVQVNTNILQS